MKLQISWDGGVSAYDTSERIVVGRGPEVTIDLNQTMVSRNHLTFAFANGRWTFEDTSSNGTFIDGERVTVGAIGGPIAMQFGGLDGPILQVEPLPEVAQAPTSSQPPAPQPAPEVLPVAPVIPPPPPAVAATPDAQSMPSPDVEAAPAEPSAPSLSADAGSDAPSMPAPAIDPTPDAPSLPSTPETPGIAKPFNSPAPPEAPDMSVPFAPAEPVEAPTPWASAEPVAEMPDAPPRAPEVSPVVEPGPPTPSPSGPPPPVGGVALGAAIGADAAGLAAQSSEGPRPGTGTIQLDDRALRLELDNVTKVFQPGQRVLVGRDPSCDMHSDSQLVSARHCEFNHDGTSWWVKDLGSTRGTWIDNAKVTNTKIEGAFFVLLGDDDAGVPVRVVTAGEHRKPKDRRPTLIAVAALAAVLIGGIAAFLFWPDPENNEALIEDLQAQIEDQRRQSDEQIAAAEERAAAAIAQVDAAGGAGNSPAELSAARLSTALISVPNEFDEIGSTGSGALVSDDGLILTNIHVVLPALEYERTGDPTFAGSFDPEEVLVAFPSVDGGPADLFYIAEQVAAHPAHDAALIRVVEGLDGATLEDLPDPLPIGDSGELLAGEEIAVVGYPGTAFTERVSVALSNFQSFQSCFEGSEFDIGWGCLRDYDEGYLNLAGETLEGGSSGGPIIRGGEVVGIQLGSLETGSSSAQNLGVPIDLIVEDLPIS